MPTPYEQRLLEMSRRANAVERSTLPSLPDLDPQVLMSPSAQFEVSAASGFSLENFDRLSEGIEEAVSRRLSLADVQAHQTRDRIASQHDQDAVARLSSPDPLPSLESIFMASAAREVGMDQVDAMAYAIAAVDDFGINYDLDIDTEAGARGVPNEAVRFQIGRESPPHRPFSAQNQSQDGIVVSQRSAGGRFETTTQRRSYEPLGPAAPRQITMAEARIARPSFTPSTTIPEAPAMSALDVISGSSFDNI